MTCLCAGTISFTMSADRELHADASDDNKLVSETSHCLIYRLLTETDYFLFD